MKETGFVSIAAESLAKLLKLKERMKHVNTHAAILEQRLESKQHTVQELKDKNLLLQKELKETRSKLNQQESEIRGRIFNEIKSVRESETYQKQQHKIKEQEKKISALRNSVSELIAKLNLKTTE